MQVFVVSLADDHARRKRLRAQLDALGVDFCFVDAVDGRTRLAPELCALVDYAAIRQRLKRPMSDTEIACALSHARLYQHLVEQQIEHAIILEDDALVDQDFALMLRDRVLQGSGRDFILLNHLYARGIRRSKTALFSGKKAYHLMALARTPKSTQAYYLTQTAAQALYQGTLPISSVADWSVDVARLNAAAITPRVVRHPKENASTIREHWTKRKKNWFPFGLKSTLRYYWFKPQSVKIS